MEDLLNGLCTKSFKAVISQQGADFISIPLKDWMLKLKTKRELSIIEDIQEIEPFIKKFIADQGENINDVSDLRKKN